MRILGIDPGLRHTGWGIIEASGNRLRFISTGLISTKSSTSFSQRLHHIDMELSKAISSFSPDSAAIEETFVNQNPSSTLKLGMARGAAITSVARADLPVAEYAARFVKKAISGSGRADKSQLSMMISHLLGIREKLAEDQSDALAVAICHANNAKTPRELESFL